MTLSRLRTLSVPNPLPASFFRGGTSKGVFLNRATLPTDLSKWDPIFLGIMGSPDPEHARQLNGMGGGVSSLSKICVVGTPSPAHKAHGIDAEYTFVQVGIKDGRIDLSGNCGNLSSMVGVFAVDEGICVPRQTTTTMMTTSLGVPRAKVRLYNTNTQKIIETTFPMSSDVPPTPVLDLPETYLAGVPGKASSILLEVLNPSGARTGKLLPTGSPLDTLTITPPSTSTSQTLDLSCIDATNPTIFVSSSQLSSFLPGLTSYTTTTTASPIISQTLELIRRSGATKMGLDPSAAAQPKIALLSSPIPDDATPGPGHHSPGSNSKSSDLTAGVDLVIHALSMGVLHRAVPITVALCAGVASKIPGTLPWRIVQASRADRSLKRDDDDEVVRMRHPSGVVEVGAEVTEDGAVESVSVVRTGRRLMKGAVWW